MSDSEIEQWVLNEIKLTTGDRLKEVCVLSSTGVVNLKGTVGSRAERLAAQTAARQANGVVRVINELKVRKGNRGRCRTSGERQLLFLSGTLQFPGHKRFRSSPAAN